MNISPSGNNLTICIGSNLTSCSDWLSFALWYTIQKHWPDARTVISLPKKQFTEILFRWLDRCKVRRYFRKENITPSEHFAKLIYEKTIMPPCLYASDHTIMVRVPTQNETNELNNAKFLTSETIQYIGNKDLDDIDAPWLASGAFSTHPLFLTFGNKIGLFDINAWDEKTKIAPFGASWETQDSTERRIQQIWNSMFSYHGMAVR